MTVKISFFGPIRRPWPEDSRQLELEEGLDVEGLLPRLGYEPGDLRRVAVVINGKRARASTALAHGDDVRFVLLAGGG